MPHITRKELKTDEFRDSLNRGAELLSEHKEWIWKTAVVIIVAALAVLGWRYYWSHLNAKGEAALASAMKIYDAPILVAGQQPTPGQLTFATGEAKYTAAQQALGQVAEHYGHSNAGKMARYLAAVSLDHLGRYQDAINWLKPMSGGGDRLGALANFELAQVYDATGRNDLAVALYLQLLKQDSPFVPKPLVLLALGDHYRAKKDPAQAAKYYQQVKSDYPNTGMADQADQRLMMLGRS